MWISVSFALLSSLVTVPLGVAAAVVTQNPYRGRALVRAVFLVPYVLPSFVVSTVWRTMLQPDGIVNAQLARFGVEHFEGLDVTLALENSRNLDLEPRRRHFHPGLPGERRVANPRQHV